MSLRKRIIVNTAEGHNKFWMLTPDPANPDHRYKCRNGRLGTNGQAQKDLDRYSGEDKLRTKISEGYRAVDERQFELLNTQAAIVGSTNKCEDLWWARRDPEGGLYRYAKIDEDLLADPEYDPNLVVRLVTRKEIAGRTEFVLVFTPEDSFELKLSTGPRATGPYVGAPVAITDKDLKKLAERVEAAMGRMFAG